MPASPMPPPVPAPELPAAFGKYLLIRRIGVGGMGEVYLAREDTGASVRAVVVKKVIASLAQNRHFVGRFLDESKVAVHLNHPNIARVFEMGDVQGTFFLAMEYIQGKTVSRMARRLRDANQPFPLGLAMLLGERICEGLAYAHAAKDSEHRPLQLVHRDLSPANVCVSYQGGVKIIDFGAAQSTLKEEMTAPGVVIGNLSYMAPEQARKEAVGPPADVYAVGAMLWELVTGRAIPQKGDPAERWRRAANPSWQAPSTFRPKLPRGVDPVLMRALRPEARQRYPSAMAFQEALRGLREKFAPAAREEELGQLLTSVYVRERSREERLLQLLLHSPATSLNGNEENLLTVLVPPTALAFEHKALGQFGEEESTESRAGPPSYSAAREPKSISRVGFGVELEEPTGEASLAREVEGEDSQTVAVDWTSEKARPFFQSVLVLMVVLLGGAALLWWWLS